jgi:polysaccharide deacetylase 2 family uncharacterized protein YibQ
MTDDLSTPLGQTTKPKRRLLPPLAIPQLLAGFLGLCVIFFIGWIAIVDDPLGGEPVVVVAADVRAPAAKNNDAAAPKAAAQSSAAAPAGGQTVTIIDGMSGKRQEVVVGGAGNGTPSGSNPASPQGNPSPSASAAPAFDPRLVEASAHGLIPKIGPDGARPSELYAQPAKVSVPSSSRVVLVVTGLGIGASGTFGALGKLPGPVTLAFAPYGTDLERWIARARGEGHEVLLQIPMEPFDYPDNDPGPQTLLTTLPAEQNLDRLHWFMSRVQGYVGIANYMGARFSANESAMAAVMREGAKRGLIYFDDASSSRSVASQIAAANSSGFAQADLVLDAVPTPAAIDAALVRLESLARERGTAVGVAKASPAAIDRLSQWAKTAESRGIALVPISAIANKPKSS